MSEISVLYLDDDLLVIDKPAGLRSIADGYDPSLPYLAGLLQAEYGHLWTVHRLDKDTSGVMVFARTADAHRHLNSQFEQRQVRKEYHALVLGRPNWEQHEVTLPLRINGDRRHRTVIDPARGQPAATSLRVLARYPARPQNHPGAYAPISLIAAFPHSGYTHQIRAHLAALRLPVYADPLYKSQHPDDRADQGLPIPDLPIQRTALHARRITLTHPTSEQQRTIDAAYPLDFQETLAFLTT